MTAATETVTLVSNTQRLSPNEFIARGQYQTAADELTRQLSEIRVAGLDAEKAALLSNLGMVYNKLGRYVDAENSLDKSMQIWKALGQTGSTNYARTLNNLANVYVSERRYAKAEDMFKDALARFRHPDNNRGNESTSEIALVLSNLALTYVSVARFSDAEHLFEESLELQRMSNDTKYLAITLNNLALAYKLQGHLEPSARMYTRALQAWRSNSGFDTPEMAVGFHNLAMVESALGQTNEAEGHFRQALDIVEAALPAEHPTRIAILNGYGDLLKKIGRKHEAKRVQALARAMRARHDHENFQDLTVSIDQIAR